MMARPVPSAQDSDAYADRRAYPRVPVAMPAFLHVDGERHAVQLHDLSPGGAKVACLANLPAATRVTLDCGSLRRDAVVRWRSEGLVGLCFDSELDAREVSALLDRARAVAARMEKGA
jgi:hypothetical protein